MRCPHPSLIIWPNVPNGNVQCPPTNSQTSYQLFVVIATLGLHLGFSLQDGPTKWYYDHWTSQPSTKLVICTGTLFWCAVSPPSLLAPVQKVCAVSPPIGTLFRKYVQWLPLPVYTFSVPWTPWLCLGFWAKLRICQVPACKVKPQSGNISWKNRPPTQPYGFSCAVSPP